MTSEPFRSVILTGERPGGSPLSHAFNVSASAMVPVAGEPSLARVMQAISDSSQAAVDVDSVEDQKLAEKILSDTSRKSA